MVVDFSRVGRDTCWCLALAVSYVLVITFPISSAQSAGDIKLFQVYYDPSGSEPEREWVQICNVSGSQHTLNNWSIHDNYYCDSIPTLTLSPDECAIIGSDQTEFEKGWDSYTGDVVYVSDGEIGNGLSNTGDRVELWNSSDCSGTRIDAMSYGDDDTYDPDAPDVPPGKSLRLSDLNDTWHEAEPDPGWNGPTLITLASFTASHRGDHVLLEWKTASEVDSAGFNLWRSEAEAGPYARLNADLIPARGGPTNGLSYSYLDDTIANGVTYWYKLEDVDAHGVSVLHGPVSATPRRCHRIYLPALLRR